MRVRRWNGFGLRSGGKFGTLQRRTPRGLWIFNEGDLKWAAALIDGEGSVVGRAVTVINTNFELLLRAQMMFGGSISVHRPEGHRVCGGWSVSGSRARVVSRLVEPFLSAKKRSEAAWLLKADVQTSEIDPPVMRRIVLCDFDATLVPNTWPNDISDVAPVEGSREAISSMRKLHHVFIFTARAWPGWVGKASEKVYQEQVYSMIEWLSKNKIEYDGITCEKIPSMFIIDDRSLNPGMFRWEDIVAIVEKADKGDSYGKKRSEEDAG